MSRPPETAAAPPPLRTLHLASGDLWAGAEVQIYDLLGALHEMPEVEVTAVILNEGTLAKRLAKRGIPVTVLDESKLSFVQILRKLAAIVRRTRPAIIHTHREKENVLGSLVTAVNRGTVSVRTVHGASETPVTTWSLRRRLVRLVDNLCARWLQSGMIAVSQELSVKLGRILPGADITVIENALDIDRVPTAAAKNPPQFRSKGRFNVAFVGRLVPVKRVDLVIEIARLFQIHHLSAQFHIFGDGPLREQLEQIVARLGLADIVIFRGFAENFLPQLAEMDALLITSDHEGLPINLLEAMALRVPVIAHAVGGIPTVLAEGRAGVLIPNQEPAAYAAALGELAAHPQAFAARVQRAYELCIRRYSVKTTAKKYSVLYHSLVSQPQRASLSHLP